MRREFAQTFDAAKPVVASDETAPAELPVRFEADRPGLRADAAASQLPSDNRLVTLVGTGGVGKTSVAIHVAERYRERHGCTVRFIDLAPLTLA